MKKVVVIGGGITGLAAAYTVQEKAKEAGAEIDYLLVEKEEWLGGKILTEQVDGFTVEGGPDCFLAEKPYVGQWAAKLGIEDRLMCSNEATKRTYVLSQGKLHELPEGLMGLVPTKILPFALSPFISWPGKFRMALDFILPKKHDNDDETLGSFVRRRLGQEALDKIAEPLIGGIHAGDPEQMSLKASFPRFLQMEQNYGSLMRAMLAARRKMPPAVKKPEPGKPKKTFFMTFQGGMAEFTDAIVKRLDPRKIMTGKEVTAIEKMTGPEGRTKYIVHIQGMEPVEADAVVVAAPSHNAAEILKKVDDVIAGKLAEIPQATSATVSMAFRRADLKKPMEAFGFLCPMCEKRKIMAVTYSSTKWNNRTPGEDYVLLRAFVGGARNQELVMQTDEEMIAMVRRELKDIIDLDAEPVMTRIYRWVKGMPQYTIGHLDRVAAVEERAAKIPGLYIAGGSYRGVGVGDCADVGAKAAEKAVEYLIG
jgi:oxygen-dependent protoporphyrinogen oxidase